MHYPKPSAAYLKTLSDDTGIIQHAHHSVPNRRLGYTTDDNSRALIVAIQNYEFTGAREDLDLAVKYLSFLHYAQGPDYKFRNVMNYERRFQDSGGTQDCLGQSLWACGYAASSCLPENFRIVARKLFDDSIIWLETLDSPRAKMYSALGIYHYLQANKDMFNLHRKLEVIGDCLVGAIHECSETNWHWCERYLTYGNAVLPLGMLAIAQVTGSKAHMDAAISTMKFLTDVTVINRRLEIVGNDSWYQCGGIRSWYDQQSVDAGYAVYLFCQAYSVLGDKSYMELAHVANSWFFGNNRAGLSLYDPESQGCCDAVIETGLNLNQGAESIIAYLLAQFAMNDLSSK